MTALMTAPEPAPRASLPRTPKGLSEVAATPNAPARPLPGFHGAVSDFKRRLIEATLTQAGGNRTRAARALGLQRTYLLRLIREFEIRVPPPAIPPRRGAGDDANSLTPGRAPV
ncbi:MAG TPA: helix-turn-helix domain-containing protein [Candidatus Dormibacteraeota bacterium]|jgi:DNA-binding NtrC family response regulator|nr:helix-turn-helix domain-containing protein [Candidatus Dormibacteraeota bacterium]